MIFRPGAITDISQAMSAITLMVEGTAFAPPVESKLRWAIENWYTEGAWDGDVLAGFMVGNISETFLNHERNAYEKGLFVLPAYRGGTTAVRLIRNFEAWAKSNGAANIWLGQSVGQNMQATLKFFERLGYTCQGFTTCKKL